MTKTMYTTLLELPLFQGLGADTLTAIIETCEMDFHTAPAGHTLWRDGDTCTGLTFLIKGCLDATATSADGTWRVTEELRAPAVVGLEVLYGSRRTHRRTLSAQVASRMMHIDKPTVASLIKNYEVFRLNVLNSLTSQVIHSATPLWLPPQETTEGRIVNFFHCHVQRPAGYKVFDISQATLGAYLGEDPRYVARALATLAHEGLIRTGRRRVEVPQFERLLHRYQA